MSDKSVGIESSIESESFNTRPSADWIMMHSFLVLVALVLYSSYWDLRDLSDVFVLSHDRDTRLGAMDWPKT